MRRKKLLTDRLLQTLERGRDIAFALSNIELLNPPFGLRRQQTAMREPPTAPATAMNAATESFTSEYKASAV